MAVKTVTYLGATIINTDDETIGFYSDNNQSIYAVPDPNDNGPQRMYAANEHRVTESNNPIWNQVQYTPTWTMIEGSDSIGHITLNGITEMGDVIPIMQHKYTASASGKKTFNLYGSSCTNANILHERESGTAGTITCSIPLRYELYEYVKLVSSWYDNAWTYRKAIQIRKTTGAIHGKSGHTDDYYGIIVNVPYTANMNTDFSDLRFCGSDGKTPLSYYIITNNASTNAVVLVMIPYYMLDKEQETAQPSTNTSGTVYAYKYPEYIYVYYGNADAASASDITLNGNAYMYDEFTDPTLANWTQTPGTGGYITQSGSTVEIGVTSAAAGSTNPNMSTPLNIRALQSGTWECILKYTNITTIGSTQDDGPYIRVRGRNPGIDGITDESGSYWDLKARYQSGGAIYNSTPDGYWGYVGVDNGISQTQYFTTPVQDGATTGYVKLRRSKNVVEGADKMSYYHSLNGYEWDFIGHIPYISNVFDTDTYLDLVLYYVNGTASKAGNVTYDTIIAYPIMGAETEYIEDNFQDEDCSGKWIQFGFGTYKTITETGGQLKIGQTQGGSDTAHTSHFETGSNYLMGVISGTPPSTTTGGRYGYGLPTGETRIYETEIASMSDMINTADGTFREAGILYSSDSSLSNNYSLLFGIRSTKGGNKEFIMQAATPTGNPTVGAGSKFGSWTASDFPIKIRMVVDGQIQNLIMQAKKTGEEWKNIGTATSYFTGTLLGSGIGSIGLYNRTAQASTNAGYSVFNYIRCYSDQFAEAADTWRPEETVQSINPTDPDELDLSMTYTVTLTNRNAPYVIQSKQYDAYDNNSKIMYLTDADIISIGPDGTDQYMAMKLEFDFTMMNTDTLSIGNIEYLYEVI